MQTTPTRPKSRASLFSGGLTSLSTSQNTYTNHQMISLGTIVARVGASTPLVLDGIYIAV